MTVRLAFVILLMSFAFGCAAAPPVMESETRSQTTAYSDFLIARFASMSNDPATATDKYARALYTAPQASGIAERAVFSALLAGDLNQAFDLAEKAEERGSQATLVRLTRGVEALRLGRMEQSRKYLDETEYGPFNSMVARGLMAWSLVKSDGPEVAETYLLEVLTGEGRLDSATLYLLGLIQSSAGDDVAALATFETLWADGARLAIGAEAFAEILAAQGQRDRALAVLTEFRNEVGTNAALTELADRIAGGETIEPQRKSMKEGAALALYVPAAALLTQTNDDLSSVYFVLALALDSDLHVARSLWAEALDNAGRREEAINVLKRVPKSSDYYATARGQMAWALRREDRNDEALKVASEALAETKDRDLKVQLADLYRSLDVLDQADTLLSDVLALDSAESRVDWRILFARGAIRQELGNWSAAEADLISAMNIEPDNPIILNYIGYSYVDRGERLKEGLDMIQRAVSLRPNSGAIVDSLGWAHFRLSNFDLAARYLERAVELEPADPVLNDHLGDAYWQTGRRDEAVFQWNRVLESAEDPDLLKAVQDKLENGLSTSDVSGKP